MVTVPRDEIEQRIARLKERLREGKLDGALFVHPADVYYFASTRQSCTLWVPADGDPLLLVRKSFLRAREETLIADVRPFPPSKDFEGLFGPSIKRLGTTFDVLPVQYYHYYSSLLPGRELVDLSLLIRELRSVKSAWELARLRESGRKLAQIFSEIPAFLKPGMRELDLAAEMECRLRKAGNEGNIRVRAFGQELIGLTSSGPQAAAPGGFQGPVTGRGISAAAPFGPSLELIAPGTPVIVDYSGTFDGYIVDMTRIAVFGSLPADLERAFDVTLEIQAWVAERLKPGIVCEELYEGTLELVEQAGLSEYFMGCPGENARFVGHGVGLELDELPILARGFRNPLREGHVVAVEPKFIFPGRGAVGIENTFAVTPSGGENLTVLPDDVMQL